MSRNEKESALIVALRALIMLGSLLALPYLAISDRLPTDELWQRAASTLQESISPSTQTAERSGTDSEAPTFRLSGLSDVARQEAPERVMLPSATPIRFVDHRSVVSESAGFFELPRLVGMTEVTKTTEEVERCLQALGAVAYHLEKWGVEDRMYRFVCEVAIEDHRQVRRHFEALGETPLLAMQQVLEEVRARTDGQANGLMSASSASDR